MRPKSIVWKVNAVFVTVLVAVIGVSSFISHRIYERDTLASARDLSRFHLETLLLSLERLMMDNDNEGIQELIAALVREESVFNDIRLISHAGRVAASSRPESGSVDQETWPCVTCHALEDLGQGLSTESFDQVVELGSGQRAVAVARPVLNETRCSEADCHAHPESDRVLGLLQAEFSLEGVDALTARHDYQTWISIALAAALSITATGLTMHRVLGRRVRKLIESTKLVREMEEVAAGDASLTFDDFGTDEVGQLADSFGDMATELQSTVMELKNTRDYMEGIVENSADIIITVGPSGRIRTFNTGAENTLGYNRYEVIGKNIEMLFADPSERRAAIAELRDSDNVTNYETHFLTKDGRVRDVILTLSRLRDPDGNPIGTFGISKDVTRENRLRRELILKEKLAGIGQAVAGIQHSMKNMLSSLKGGTYMVETGLEERDRELTEEGWAMVQEGISNITELSSRMLSYVKGWDPEVEEADIGELVASIYNAQSDLAESKEIKLHAEVAEELPPVLCDPRLMKLALTDLVANALDACGWKDYPESEPPEVFLRARMSKHEGFVEIEVKDNGQGMTDDIRKNIFTPFFSTKKRLGTGLGLALTSRIIRKHGGNIDVESEITIGSTFRVSLPIGGPLEQNRDHYV